MYVEKVDVLIIGFGKGGKTLAPFLASQGKKVVVVEKSDQMYGGTCINVGCIPTKSLSYNSERVAALKLRTYEQRNTAFQEAMKQKNELVSALRSKNFDKLNQHPNISILNGVASFVSPTTVKITSHSGEMLVKADSVFINTGAKPFMPDIPGILESRRVYTSSQLLDLQQLPQHLVIVGSGYIGLEFASMFANFGSRVTVVERTEQFLPREDKDVADEVRKVLENKGVAILFGHKINEIVDSDQVTEVKTTAPDGTEEVLAADAVLIAAGRVANTSELDLDAAGIERTPNGFVKTDDKLRTNIPNIWALGDVNGGPQFTYVSLDDYRIVRDQLFGEKKRTSKHRRFIPYSVFIHPALSRVGLSETEAIEKGYQVKVATMPATASTRAHTMGKTDGFLKAVVNAETNQLLGCTLFCADSSEVINVVGVFMQSGQPFTVLRDTMFTHPSVSDALNDLLAQIN